MVTADGTPDSARSSGKLIRTIYVRSLSYMSTALRVPSCVYLSLVDVHIPISTDNHFFLKKQYYYGCYATSADQD